MKPFAKRLIPYVMVLSIGAAAQVSTGTPPFASLGGGPFDAVNLGNLNVHFVVPILHKAGRGVPFSYDLSYDSSIWSQASVRGVIQWTPSSDWGWTAQSYAVLGHIGYSTVQTSQTSGRFCPGSQFGTKTVYTTTYTYVDWKRRSHPFPGGTTETETSGACDIITYGSALTSQTSDGSGYTIYAPANQVGMTVTTRSGHVVSSANGTYTDNNGNQLTANSTTGKFFDTISSSTAVLTQAGSGTSSSPITYTYTPPSGTNVSYSVHYTDYTVATNFGFSGTIAEYGPVKNPLVSSITLPDNTSYSFTYEATPGTCTPLSGTSSCVTGRISTVTLPTGGSISYTYSGGTHNTGIYSDGSTSALSRHVAPGGSGQSGTWSYTRQLVSGSPGPGSIWTTTVEDAASNYTVINFAEDSTVTNTASTPPTTATYNLYETQRQAYQGAVSTNSCSSTITTNCLLATSINCYNAHYSGCPTASVASPVTQTDSYRQLLNGSTALSEIVYNGSGLVTHDKEYGYGVSLNAAPSSTYLVRETITNYATLGNGIVNRPSSVVVKDWTAGGAVLSSTTYTYDEGTLATSSSTPQHVSVSGSRGNLTTLATQASSTITLYRKFTYYDTGMPNNSTGVDTSSSTTCTSKPSICTTYTYSSATASCGNAFPTGISEPLSLSRSMTWNCTGAVSTQVTDENSKNVTTTYSDPDFWRPYSVTDQMTNQTTIAYNAHIAAETTLNFNSGTSTADSLSTVDGLGRPIFSQRLQAPSSGNYDTIETDYNSLGQPDRFTMAYTTGPSPSTNNLTVAATTKTYDALGRVLTITDPGSGTVTYTYTNNDVLQQVAGPQGTQMFQKQFEYDGLGRLTSVCEISSTLPNIGTCSQNTPQSGYWTQYTYDALGRLLTVTQNSQATTTMRQHRAFTYDMLSRTLTESNPETGNNGVNGIATYTYDIACTTTPASPGDLTTKVDAAGNKTCYAYDALHRMTAGGYSTVCRRFHYDTGGTPPTGVTVANTKTRLVEASTDNCGTTTYTDEWFSYDARGELTDVYESTPNSGGYYHSSAGYWPNGALNTLSLFKGSGTALIPQQTYAVDGEGRTSSVGAASGQAPVTSVTYSPTAPLGALTKVTFGSADSDAFTYDPNTGRMATYTFSVNSKTDVGTLTWSANGTLQKLVINDQIPSTVDSQTCNYGYDDLQRVSNVTCGTFWVQNFSYDALGNITKNVPQGDGGQTFLPSYWTTPPTNQFTSLPGVTVAYDGNGNLLTDNLNTYTWDPNWGTMKTVTTGSSTVTTTYDALGRMVENNAGGSYTQFVYGPTGKIAKCSGQTLVKAFVALPGGAKAIYNSSGVLAYYRHSDWLGSSRLTSTATTPTSMYSSSAYAPFGEQYATAGTGDASFTGQDQDTVSNLYDFPARRHSPSQGRWISPDPLGRGAVTLTNPQSWNRYAYVNNNPLRLVDSLGLDVDFCGTRDASCGVGSSDGGGSLGSGGGGDGGGDAGSGGGCDPNTDPTCGDNSGDPGNNCDEQCQADQALLSATLDMLTNSNCAALIGGPSAAGQAAAVAAVASQLFGNPNSQIQFSATPDPGISGFAETDLSTITTPPITVGVGAGFYDPGYTAQNGLSSLSFAQNQTVTILHEYGHAMGDLYAINNNGQYGYGITTNIMSPDNPLTNPGVSNQNDQNVAGACLQGGNVPTQTSQVDGTIQ